MMKIKIANILMLFATIGIFSSASLQAQDSQLATSIVKAKILDESGKPITQVLVKSFFANDKALTNFDGNFSIKVDPKKDQLVIATDDYEPNSIQVIDGTIDNKDIVLVKKGFMGNRVTELPYQTLSNDRTVSSVYTVTGDELASFPSSSFIEALSGRIPGLVITTYTNNPVQEYVFASLRGEPASFYIDGIQRDPSDLTVFEVETVQVIKDLSGRAALGLSGNSPVIWIKTKSGKKFQREITVSAESGINSATRLPDFVDSYNNAMLYNEALKNDGLQPYYSATDLTKYKDGSDPLYHSNIDYYKRYVTQATPFRRANVNFRGGDDAINYFSLIDLMQSEGLEAIGENSKYSRFKLRGGVNVKLNDIIQFKINLSGTYGKSKYPNEGDSAQQFNIFNYISKYPSNAHAISFEDKYIMSTEFPLNLDNELKNTGYANGVNLNSQNNVSLLLDLKSILKGLTFNTTAAFDLYNSVVTSKGGTAAVYRLLANEQLTEVQQKVVQPNLNRTGDNFTRGTTT
ncbi:MAG: TonB-dependent receptor plug domain-containing protein, partial [Flavobacterium sp.]